MLPLHKPLGLALLFSLNACNSDKPLTDEDYTLYSRYTLDNQSNYSLTFSSELRPQIETLDKQLFQGQIASGERKQILAYFDLSQATNPPSSSFKQLQLYADSGQGEQLVYQLIDDQHWQLQRNDSNQETYLLTIVDADLNW
ncbi:hypothetical protein [Agarivorans sp. Alg241-V36]|uniref:hypothetical protein n=1 Tax=Agarivorans sp. Alg241-V36 TaxID=2305992 RepID=UPI0013CFA9D1|nr:hypothetical protein [Agarivorans sp. Alg241-V36]